MIFADKVAAKDKVAKLVGKEKIIPTLWGGESPDDIAIRCAVNFLLL
jgi:hypothetical protein